MRSVLKAIDTFTENYRTHRKILYPRLLIQSSKYNETDRRPVPTAIDAVYRAV